LEVASNENLRLQKAEKVAILYQDRNAQLGTSRAHQHRYDLRQLFYVLYFLTSKGQFQLNLAQKLGFADAAIQQKESRHIQFLRHIWAYLRITQIRLEGKWAIFQLVE
jgi:hypothetical protein